MLDQKIKLHFLIAPFFVALVLGTFLAYFNNIRTRLKESNEQFRAVVDIAEEFIYYRNLDGIYQYASPSCEKLTGYPPSTFYQIPNFMNDIIHAQDREFWMGHIHSINDKRDTETLDVRIVTKSGEIKWMKHICATVSDENGQQIGVRASNVDITQQKDHDNQIFNMAFYDP
ncbi:MAG: PAS domain-containing protein, partial [Gammaproteobacteria bacterium]|nr:PAS domain-containing protein [Gammaproteobacteria bacterium]